MQTHKWLQRSRRFYPQSLLGELVLGVLASMAIGTGFSILAGAFVLVLAGGRVETSTADGVGTPAWIQSLPTAQRFTRGHHD